MITLNSLTNCHDCGAKPGQVHLVGCDVEQCSVCGGQKIQCNCKGHNKFFAKWTGIWPGKAEAEFLGIDLNTFHMKGYPRIFFVEKPKP